MTTSESRSEWVITLEDFHRPLDGERIVTAKPSDTLEDAEMRMDSRNIDQVPVVDPKSELMVLTRRMISKVPSRERTAMLVEEVPGVDQTLWQRSASTSLPAAERDLIEHDWVITTDEHGEPIGLVTVGDALKEALAHLRRSRRPRGRHRAG